MDLLNSCFLLVNEALDDILADSDDEEEEQAIVNQVLDEIGIEITNKVIFFWQIGIFITIWIQVQIRPARKFFICLNQKLSFCSKFAQWTVRIF